MHQQTFAEATFERYRKPTRREVFLDDMDRVIPWGELAAVIDPFYPKPDGAGRPPVGVERMLRIHCLQQWFNLSDPAVEEALYDSRAMRRFVGIDWVGNRCLMRRRSANFGICWKSIVWVNGSLR
jgi:IS5 family transposase